MVTQNVSIKITEKDLELIKAEVEHGNALNVSDYIKRAIIEKMSRTATA